VISIRKAIIRLAAFSNQASGFIAGICILATAFFVTYEVILRALFDAPTEWVNEVSVYLILISAFLGFSPALAAGKHISVDLITCKLSNHANRFLGVVISLLGLGFCLVFFVTSAEMALNSYQLNMLSTSTLRIPLYIPQASLPVGFAIMTLQFLANLLTPACALQDKEDSR